MTGDPTDETYSGDEVREASLEHGRAMFAAARGNRNARRALRESGEPDRGRVERVAATA